MSLECGSRQEHCCQSHRLATPETAGQSQPACHPGAACHAVSLGSLCSGSGRRNGTKRVRSLCLYLIFAP